MIPVPYRVVGRRAETHDTATLVLRPVDVRIGLARPGQFTMLYAFGVGEVPISMSGLPDGDTLVHTLRAVGAVTRALYDSRPGDVLGVRGPFGLGWRPPERTGGDLVLVAGGIGLAPLRPVLAQALALRSAYRRVCLLVGARTPDDLLYGADYDGWRAAGADVWVTVDRPVHGWTGAVGVVPFLLDALPLEPDRTTAMVCGPEIMMRFTAAALRRRGVPADAIQLSLERCMHCGVGWCGHCQLGPLMLCRDGPVVDYGTAEPLLAVREL